MYNAMLKKFRQNEELRVFLLSTGKKELIEANTTDTRSTWGVGLSIQNEAVFKHENWRGKNLAGNIMARVRQTLS